MDIIYNADIVHNYGLGIMKFHKSEEKINIKGERNDNFHNTALFKFV